jgi:hypothetical protein
MFVFDKHSGRLVIRQTSPNGQGTGSCKIKKIEFFSLDPDYSDGVLGSLFNQHRADIRRFIQIRASGFHLESLHDPGNQTNVTASNGDSCRVQFELTDAKLVPTGYWLTRSPDHRLRLWSLRGSNDPRLPLGQWTSLDRRHEEREGEFDDSASFPCFGEAF